MEQILNQFREEVLARRAYGLNLVELLCANENAHTRILVEVLRYDKGDGKLEVTESFLHEFLRECIDSPDCPTVECQAEYMDAVIGEKGKYVVVIENKINWAVDQWKQIETYITNAAERYEVGSEKVYFIYLTDNGFKKASEDSLSLTAKELLGMTCECRGRYIELNYADDILPWLEKSVLANCRYVDKGLISALEQYCDYLRRRLFPVQALSEDENLFLKNHVCGDASGVERYARCKDVAERISRNDSIALSRAAVKLSEVLRAEMDRLVSSDYGLDASAAAMARQPLIREWLRACDSEIKPHRYYGDTSYIEYVTSDGRRMKYQFDEVSGNARSLSVCMFDNAGGEITVFKDLCEKFRATFPDSVMNDSSTRIGAIVEVASKEALMSFLDSSGRAFLLAFVGEMKRLGAERR